MRYPLKSLFLLLILVYSCKTAKPISAGMPPAGTGSKQAGTAKDQILFVMLNSAASDNNTTSAFTVAESSNKDGKLKKNKGNAADADFTAYYTTASGQAVDSVTFTDPLKQKTEYADENGKIAVLEGQKNTLAVLRVNYQPAMKKIRIVNRSTGKIINEFNL